MKIVIAGGSGLIGRKLTRVLLEQGHHVAWLSRSKQAKVENVVVYHWDPDRKELATEAFKDCAVFINLSGESIADKNWTLERKKTILESRTKPQNFLEKAFSAINFSGTLHIAASAIGYYGAQSSDTVFEESSAPMNDFMGQTCLAWEQASASLFPYFKRNVVLRIGVVLSKQGGALKKMQIPFQFGLGAAFGSGKQQMPWIHEADLIGIICKAIAEEKYNGVYNAVAPNPVSNLQFSASLAKVLGRPFFLPPLPSAFLRLIMGEMAVIVLEGSKVSSEKIKREGYQFQFPELIPALKNIYG
jgi:uncharacterized protein (TIGR01777 family)